MLYKCLDIWFNTKEWIYVMNIWKQNSFRRSLCYKCLDIWFNMKEFISWMFGDLIWWTSIYVTNVWRYCSLRKGFYVINSWQICLLWRNLYYIRTIGDFFHCEGMCVSFSYWDIWCKEVLYIYCTWIYVKKYLEILFFIKELAINVWIFNLIWTHFCN